MNNKKLHMVAFLLLVVGGLNWGLIGFFDWGIGNVLSDAVARIVYILIGLAAVYEFATHKNNCAACKKGDAPQASQS